MKIRILNLLLIMSLVLFMNCDNDDENSSENDNSFNVTVLRQGNKCGIIDNDSDTIDYLIEFSENATNLPIENNTIYYAANLPENYKVNDILINITFRDINENDEILCAAFIGGDEYPFIYILSAE